MHPARAFPPRRSSSGLIALFCLCFAALPALRAGGATTVAATKDDGVAANARVQQGDTVNYSVVISNTGGALATGVTFNDTPDANTTLVSNSVHASPIAFADSYTAVGNTKLYVGTTVPAGEPAVTAATGILANDTISTSPDTIAFTAFSGSTSQGGTVVVNVDGTFTYTPAVGFSGTDTFTYTIKNSADATLTDTGTVTITVSNPVWYVDNSYAGGNGTSDGSSTRPFTSPAAVNGSSYAANATIYFYKGSGTYSGGLTLKSGQTLTSEHAALVANSITLRAAVPANTPTLSATSGNVVTLSTGNTVTGFIVNNTTGSANGISGSAIGTTAISDIAITTVGGGTALSATTSGTLTVTGAANTLSSTGGSALVVQNVTIGASGLNFQSIASSGGSGTGIILDTTGASGGLTVTGDGSNTSPGGNASGGTISGKSGSDNSTTTGIGIYLNSTQNVVLRRMTINGTNQNFAIRGNNVTNFTLQYCTVAGTNGTTVGEDAIYLANLLGSATIDSCPISGGATDNLHILNSSGTLNRLTVTNTTFGATQNGANANDSFLFDTAAGATTANVTVDHDTFHGAVGDLFQANAVGSVAMDVVFTNNTCDNASISPGQGGGGVTLSGGGTGNGPTYTYNVAGNTLKGALGSEIAVAFLGTATTGSFHGTIANNTTGVSGQNATGGFTGIEVFSGGPLHTVTISGNTVQQYSQIGIFVHGSQAPNPATINATITNNVIRQPYDDGQGDSFAGLDLDIGNPTDHLTANALISGNTMTGSFVASSGIADVSLSAGTTSSINLSKGASNSSTATGVIQDLNTIDSNSVFTTGTTNLVGSTPVTLLFAPGSTENFTANAITGTLPPRTTQATSRIAGESTAGTSAPAHILAQSELDSVVAAALARWEATGLSSAQIARLHRLRFEVASLPALQLGEADGRRIRVSDNAGGHGWFIATDSNSDAPFARTVGATRRYADSGSAPAGRVDLLTAIMHEMGHALGLNDAYGAQDRDSLMYGWLTQGERRLPAPDEARGAIPGEDGITHFLGIPTITIGTLPVGKSVTIKYAVTVNSNLGDGSVGQVSNQGTVSGGNFTTVSTDDPNVGGATDPTVTLLAIPPAVTTNPATQTVSPGSVSFTAAATGVPAPTVQWQVSTDGGATFNNISGATSATLAFTASTADTGKQYRAVFTNNTNLTATTTAATLTVLVPPTITIAFNPTSVPLNGTSTLTFTVANPNAATMLTGVGFTDNLPAGVVVAATPNLTGDTTGVTATASATSISLAGASIAANGSISFTVDVTGSTAGAKNNITGTVSSTNGGTGSASNTATLTVVAPPTISKAFGVSTISISGTATLTFTIVNPNATVALNGIAFTDNLPAGVTVGSTPGVVNNLGGGTVTADAGASTISLAAGTLAANQTKTIVVNITGTSAGVKNNTTGAISSTEGGTGATSNTAMLTVLAPPSIAKAFGAASVPLNGTATLTFTITNSNSVDLTGVAFTDTFPSGMAVAATPNASNTAGGTFTAIAAAGSVSLTGGTVPANTSKTVAVDVTGTTSGAKNNTTGAVSSTNGGTGTTSNTATLTVASPPSVTTSGGATSATERVAVVIDSGITVSDVDSTTLDHATVSITDNFHTGEDVLAFANDGSTMGNISGSYDGTAGVLTLTSSGATATLAQWQAALRAVTYTDTSHAPNTSTRTITFVVNDGGLDSDPATKTVTITAVNDAPTLSGGPYTLTSTNEDTTSGGTAVSTILGGVTYADADASALSGIAITAKTGNGTWQYSTDGSTWNGFGSVSATSALLLTSTTQVRYIPDNLNGETATFTFRAWDQTSGTASTNTTPGTADSSTNGGTTAFSTGTASASLIVTSVNDAPTLAGGPSTLTGTNEDTTSSGTAVSTILAGTTYADVDASALSGIAITAKTGNGTWQYSTDGSTWNGFGSVSATSALLLTSTTQVRYIPDNLNGETATFTFRAWDQTSGTASTNTTPGTADPSTNGGTTAFSTGTASASLTVTSVNDAPTLAGGPYTLTGTDENTTSSGTVVSAILGGVTHADVDTGALSGIAITATTGNGTWQYSTDGNTWNSFGTVSATSALLLTSTTQVRYAPDTFNGETATFTFRAWDQTSGTASTNGAPGTADSSTNGGTTAFSTGTASASLIVTSVNDAPTNIVLSAATVNQSSSANVNVGTLTTTDVDIGDTFTYSLVSGTGSDDNAAFNIAGDKLRAATPATMAPRSYAVRIRTTDSGTATFEKSFTIVVTDDVAPTIVSVTGPDPATYGLGQNLDFTVTFSEPVNVVTTGGTPTLPLTLAGTAQNAAYFSGGGTATLVFRYTVQAGDHAADGEVVLVSPLALNGGTIKDAAGNNAALTFTPPALPGVIVEASYHSADTNQDWALSLDELTRVIQLYNTMDGTTRTGAYHTQPGTEDGFAPGPGTIVGYHSADSNHDGVISLDELTRVIQLYNTMDGTTRTGAYHRQDGTEDGFAPGPPTP